MRLGLSSRWLVLSYLALLSPFPLGAEETSSKAAHRFVYRGVPAILSHCSRPLPPLSCTHGKLLKAGPLQHLQSSNTGERFTYQEFTYDGMALVYRAKDVVSLNISKSTWPGYMNLKVGVSRLEVIRALGKPAVESDESIEYRVNEDWVQFTIEPNSRRVAGIQWNFYYD